MIYGVPAGRQGGMSRPAGEQRGRAQVTTFLYLFGGNAMLSTLDIGTIGGMISGFQFSLVGINA